MALDVVCRLTLTTIFRPLSDDGFLTLFFRLGARLGSTSFRQCPQKLRPQRGSNPQFSNSKSDALSVRLCGLLRFSHLFFCNYFELNQVKLIGWVFFICEPRLGSSTKELKFTATEGFEPPLFRFGSRHLFRWAVKTFPILFRYSQWINWSVKWPSMCSVVSLLLPSFVLWVMMVSLHFFRLVALGSSTYFRHCIQKLRP